MKPSLSCLSMKPSLSCLSMKPSLFLSADQARRLISLCLSFFLEDLWSPGSFDCTRHPPTAVYALLLPAPAVMHGRRRWPYRRGMFQIKLMKTLTCFFGHFVKDPSKPIKCNSKKKKESSFVFLCLDSGSSAVEHRRTAEFSFYLSRPAHRQHQRAFLRANPGTGDDTDHGGSHESVDEASIPTAEHCIVGCTRSALETDHGHL